MTAGITLWQESVAFFVAVGACQRPGLLDQRSGAFTRDDDALQRRLRFGTRHHLRQLGRSAVVVFPGSPDGLVHGFHLGVVGHQDQVTHVVRDAALRIAHVVGLVEADVIAIDDILDQAVHAGHVVEACGEDGKENGKDSTKAEGQALADFQILHFLCLCGKVRDGGGALVTIGEFSRIVPTWQRRVTFRVEIQQRVMSEIKFH